MKIGLDIMGGDFAPEATVLGAIESRKVLPADVELVLIGDQDKIVEILNREKCDISQFQIVHASDVIEMGEHPAKAFKAKPNSSVAVGFGLLHKGLIDGFASAGNTGAMLVGAMYTVKAISGIIRPCIGSYVPTDINKYALLLDVGLNPDSRPDVLYQYGILGKIYAESVMGITNPRIGLVNIGSEKEKGNMVAQSTHELMEDSKDFNFVGNVEGNELFGDDKADVFVCDGFVGNVILKEAEGFYKLAQRRKIDDEFFEMFNFEHYGGTPVLGINKPVIIGHGISNVPAIKNMILQTQKVIEGNLVDKIKEAFN
ncbi:MAG: phosphate acyltransferase PlsX [Bacteroidales bacterium]|nr:phosphate acyltransferase PlsX [Bacteroidales bacterium]